MRREKNNMFKPVSEKACTFIVSLYTLCTAFYVYIIIECKILFILINISHKCKIL